MHVDVFPRRPAMAITVVIKAGITERFQGAFRDAGLILPLPLESQQVAVLINGA